MQLLTTSGIDAVHIAFNRPAQEALKVFAAAIMFSVAVQVTPEDLRRVARRPAPIALCIGVQYLLMPAISVLLARILDVHASVALGMILVACCPSGKISSWLAMRANADVALSISSALVSNLVCILAFPFAFPLWAKLDPAASDILHNVHPSTGRFLGEIVLILLLPVVVGLVVASRYPQHVHVINRRVGGVAMALFLCLVVASVVANWSVLIHNLGTVFWAVVVQDAIAFGLGYLAARLSRLDVPGRRTISLEVGVRNTGLALVLALGFLKGLGGVALVAAMWSVWDVAAGIAVASWWSRRTSSRALAQ